MFETVSKSDSGCNSGETLKEHQFPGLSLSEAVHTPNSALTKHSHNATHFCFVVGGEYAEVFGSKTILCKPSSLIYHPKRISHSNKFSENGARCFTLEVTPKLMARIDDKSLLNDDINYFAGGLAVNYAKKIYREFCLMDDFSSLSIEGLVLELLVETSRRSSERENGDKPRWLNDLLDILHTRFSESLALVELAKIVGRHPAHISREFRKHYGCTLGEYIRSLRVEFACSKLSGSAMPLSDIAYMAGFSQQSHFCSSFKQIMGMTPKQFKELSHSRNH